MMSYQSNQPDWFSWHFLRVNNAGLLSGGILCLRFFVLVLLLTLTSATLSTLEIVHGLDILFKPLNRIGIPSGQAAMVIQIMLRFIPSLALNAEKIAKSQAARGAVWGDPKGNLFQKTRQCFAAAAFVHGQSTAGRCVSRSHAGTWICQSEHAHRFERIRCRMEGIAIHPIRPAAMYSGVVLALINKKKTVHFDELNVQFLFM